MHVLVHKEADFQHSLARLRRAGGNALRAAQQVDAILGRLWQGALPEDAFRLTRNGESRIPHCWKYDLSDAHRLVCLKDETSFWLLFVGSHAETDRWIESHPGLKPVADKKTGRLELIYEVRAKAPLPQQPPRPVFDTNKPLLDLLPAEALDPLRLGPQVIARLRGLLPVSTDDELLDAAQSAGEEIQDLVLSILLALRDRDASKALALISVRIGAARPVLGDKEALGQVLAADCNADVVVDLRQLSEPEMAQVLRAGEFQDWLLYLHPDQKAVATAVYPGATWLGGISGSGKTSVLIHRAKLLADRYPADRILIVTLPTLAELIDRLISRLVPEPARGRIAVKPMPRLCEEIIRHFERRRLIQDRDPVSNERLEDNWPESFDRPEQRETLAPILGSLEDREQVDPSRYIHDETIWVRSAFRKDGVALSGSKLHPESVYCDPQRAPRKGREIPFSRDWRERILRAIRHYQEWLEAGGFCDDAEKALLAHTHLDALIQRRPPSFAYRAILVDEVQEFGNVELEILRALALDGPDSLFLTGDRRQQVSPKDHDLPATGVAIATRKYFRRNYRNTRQILEAAVALGQKYCSSSEDGLEALDPEYSVRESARPLVVAATDHKSEMSFVAEIIRKKHEVDDLPVCIVACGVRADEASALTKLQAEYKELGLEVVPLGQDSAFGPKRVFISGLETVKGFEFSLVIATQCSEDCMPDASQPKGEWWRDARRLYVAMTRARDEVIISHSGKPSTFLTGIREQLLWSTIEEEHAGTRPTAAALKPTQPTTSPTPVPPPIMAPMSPAPAATKELVPALRSAGLEVVDKRDRGGALWVVGGRELATLMSEMRRAGYYFRFAAGGGGSTGYRPAWWTK